MRATSLNLSPTIAAHGGLPTAKDHVCQPSPDHILDLGLQPNRTGPFRIYTQSKVTLAHSAHTQLRKQDLVVVAASLCGRESLPGIPAVWAAVACHPRNHDCFQAGCGFSFLPAPGSMLCSLARAGRSIQAYLLPIGLCPNP